MKTKLILISLLAAIAMAFVSCSREPGLIELSKDDITDSWVQKGTWSGTQSTQIGDNDPVITNVSNMKLTAATIKSMYGSTNANVGTTFGITYDCTVYTNLARTKIVLRQDITTTILGSSTKTVTRWELERD